MTVRTPVEMPKKLEVATIELFPIGSPGIYAVDIQGAMAIQSTPIRLRWVAPGWSQVWGDDEGWQIVGREDCGTFHDPDEAVAAAIRLAMDPDA